MQLPMSPSSTVTGDDEDSQSISFILASNHKTRSLLGQMLRQNTQPALQPPQSPPGGASFAQLPPVAGDSHAAWMQRRATWRAKLDRYPLRPPGGSSRMNHLVPNNPNSNGGGERGATPSSGSLPQQPQEPQQQLNAEQQQREGQSLASQQQQTAENGAGGEQAEQPLKALPPKLPLRRFSQAGEYWAHVNDLCLCIFTPHSLFMPLPRHMGSE
jgi:hypothetical protein